MRATLVVLHSTKETSIDGATAWGKVLRMLFLELAECFTWAEPPVVRARAAPSPKLFVERTGKWISHPQGLMIMDGL